MDFGMLSAVVKVPRGQCGMCVWVGPGVWYAQTRWNGRDLASPADSSVTGCLV